MLSSKQAGTALVRDAVCALAFRTGLSAPPRQSEGRFTIVTFHRVLPEKERSQYPIPGLVVTPEELDFCVDYLNQHYSCHPLGEAYRRLLSGKTDGKPYLAITFDDGQLDNLEHACPVLKAHDVRATFYVVPQMSAAQESLWHDRLGFAALASIRSKGEAEKVLFKRLGVKRADYESDTAFVSAVMRAAKLLEPEVREEMVRVVSELSGGEPPPWARLLRPDEVAKMHKEGHEIGSHTNSHVLLPQCADEELEAELVGSRTCLEEWLAAPVQHFCYPNGDHDERTEVAVAKAGYSTGVTTTFGINNRQSDPFKLRRFDVTSRSLRNRKGILSASRLAWTMSRFRRER